MKIQLLNRLDRVFLFFGQTASIFSIALVFLIVVDVVLRYFFQHSEAWMTELEWHIFSLIFLLGGAYTFQYDGHVRVDLIYNRLSEKAQVIINLIGSVVFLIPWCFIVIRSGFKYAKYAFLIQEGSADPGGLGMRYLIKFCVVLSFFILLCYTLFLLYKIFLFLKGKRIPLFLDSQKPH